MKRPELVIDKLSGHFDGLNYEAVASCIVHIKYGRFGHICQWLKMGTNFPFPLMIARIVRELVRGIKRVAHGCVTA